MLTRDVDVKKRAFFLRHWVRSEDQPENTSLPLVAPKHIAVAEQDHVLMVRVDIDRPLVPVDTFKSVPFATWMFQVVQLDAVIDGLPGVRFAFAIERTVTAEERNVISESGISLPIAPKAKPAAQQIAARYSAAPPHTTQPIQPARTVRTTPVQPVAPPAMVQRPAPTYPPPSNMRPVQNTYQQNVGFGVSRQPIPVRPNTTPHVVPRTQYTPPVNRVVGRTPSRPPPANPVNPPVAALETLRPVLHPYLRLWEDRDLDDPYEPLFVTEDLKFEEKARGTWLVESTPEFAKRADYHSLFGIPTPNYPSYFFEGPDLASGNGEADMEVVVQRKRKSRATASDVTNSPMEDDGGESAEEFPLQYSEFVVAAAEYNNSLRNERSNLRQWLTEDHSREEEESDEEDDDDEGDGDSSD